MGALDDDYNRANDEQRARLMQAAESDGSGTGWTWDALASGLSKAAVQELRALAPEARRAWAQAKRGTTLPGQMRNVERLAGGAADALYGPSRALANAENAAASPPEPGPRKNRSREAMRREWDEP